ncbi:MAG: baseplate wedge protein 53 [Cetobacterium sp.]|uniref:baseplate wedge protein 53 n=1 Tax=Cetobacterium sp. TaxID=2071632 RepID=UPI003F3FF43B
MYINNNEGELTALLAQSVIAAQQDEYTFLKSSIITNNGGRLIAYSSVIEKYVDYLKDNSFSVRYTNEERIKYKYNPKRLSYDMYNTTRLFFIILLLNNMKSKVDFDRDVILVPKPNALKEILEKIKMKEQDIIDMNREKNDI